MKAKICFFDDFYVAARPGTLRRTFRPERLGDYVDDNPYQTYTSFFYDSNVGKYRLYYEVPMSARNTEIRKLMLAEADTVEDLIEGKGTLCEVEGLDPDGIHGCSVALCTHEGRVDNYILAGNFRANERSRRCMFTAHSSDGVHFTEMRKIHEDYSDAYNAVYYNPHTREYSVLMRATIMDRRIFRIASRDFVSWSRPELILHPAADGNNGVQFYSMGVNEIDGLFYGLVWRFMTDMGQPDLTDMYGYMDCDLYYSYDGEHFSPTGLSPVCERPLPPTFGCKQLWLLNTCNTPDGRTVLCGGASAILHGSKEKLEKYSTTAFYGIRKDGFCAIEGLGANSTVYLKRFVCRGGELSVNFNACLGALTAAILDDKGQPYEGFSFEDCIPLAREESTGKAICWKGAATLDALRDKPIHVAIRLNGAMLYTVTLEGSPCFRHPQVSLGNLLPELPIDHSYD